MKKEPDSFNHYHADGVSLNGEQQPFLARLRYYSWLSATLLFAPWLVTILLYLPFIENKPTMFLVLLPGLAIALHIQMTLYRNLHLNYSELANKLLFPTLGIANWITLCRAAAIVALAGFLPIAIWDKHLLTTAFSWAPGCLYLAISLSDLLDGFAARKTKRITELGKRLDIETDAAGLLVASLVAIALGRLPIMYVLVGIAYYLFSLGIWLRKKQYKPLKALQQRPYSRIIAGFQMGLVAMVLLPLFQPTFTSLAAIIFMTPLLLGFLRDWLVVSYRVKTNTEQSANLDTLSESPFIRALPLLLRLIIIWTGIHTIITHTNLAFLPWLVAHSMLCLLAVFGFMGRSSCLLLILLLASTQSPFGATIVTIVTFTSATLLMLIGTGTISLWAPEESILYRRFPKKSDKSDLMP